MYRPNYDSGFGLLGFNASATARIISVRGVARTGRGGGGGPDLANVSVVGRVSVKFPCYMLLTGRGEGSGHPPPPPPKKKKKTN